MDPILAFGIGLIFWGLIIFEVFKGDSAKAMERSRHLKLKSSFKLLRLFILIGWAIYPLGYYYRSKGGTELLNVAYNLADVINKIGFSLVIYLLARSDTQLNKSDTCCIAATVNNIGWELNSHPHPELFQHRTCS